MVGLGKIHHKTHTTLAPPKVFRLEGNFALTICMAGNIVKDIGTMGTVSVKRIRIQCLN